MLQRPTSATKPTWKGAEASAGALTISRKCTRFLRLDGGTTGTFAVGAACDGCHRQPHSHTLASHFPTQGHQGESRTLGAQCRPRHGVCTHDLGAMGHRAACREHPPQLHSMCAAFLWVCNSCTLNTTPITQVLLGFNEPNHGEQANMLPAKAAALWPQLEKAAARWNLRLASPAAAPCGKQCTGGLKSPFDWWYVCTVS